MLVEKKLEAIKSFDLDCNVFVQNLTWFHEPLNIFSQFAIRFCLDQCRFETELSRIRKPQQSKRYGRSDRWVAMQ